MVIFTQMNALAALADPSRRRIVEMLTDGERTAGDLGAQFEISQPAVSKHLRVLRNAGLVEARAQAQRRLYRLNPAPLAEVDAWFSRYRNFWGERIDSLKAILEGDGDTKLILIPVRFPGRVGPEAGWNACGRRLRSFGLPLRTTAA
jgi:DNA-binding transcriptional ArsR family regulator